MASSKFYLALVAILTLATACNNSKSLSGSTAYEDDEIYYQKGETFISDVPVSSTSQDASSSNSSSSTFEDDYYSGNDNTSETVNNYYGDVYQNDSWSSFGGWGRPYSRFVFNPYFGWHLSYGGGGYYGWNPYLLGNWNSGWGFGYGYGMGFNTFNPYWYNPYGMYYGFGYWGYNNQLFAGNTWNNFNDLNNGIIYGHRPTFSTNSVQNSVYTNNTLFSGRKLTSPLNDVNPTRPNSTSGVNSRPSGSKGESSGSRPNGTNNNSRPKEDYSKSRNSGDNSPSPNVDRNRGNSGGNRPAPSPNRGNGGINRGGSTSPGSGGSRSGGSSSPSRSGGGSGGGKRR